ncbi:Poly(ADP-ribose) glycohydrolase like protein [Aduncisulcus paluster]|uniref:Poly(ADP-ribose) glycohydrolase like protein n=1 Tax=Aduncisulcus paluster TaxID=2918883 RepID=A0ABQ5KTU6_9EUKA|nr:Poly(ADP-ribose) glycohydrolase like protein [Aduncisulcus paluster]
MLEAGRFSAPISEVYKYGPTYVDDRKVAIFKTILAKRKEVGFDPDRVVTFVKYLPDKLFHIKRKLKPINIQLDSRFFVYDDASDIAFTTEHLSCPSPMIYHVNFADGHLFGFYANSLFAQDEIQTLEIPDLAAIKEAAVEYSHERDASSKYGDVSPRTKKRPSFVPYVSPVYQNISPCICLNVRREVSIDTGARRDIPSGLYGNRFHLTPVPKVLSACSFHPFGSPTAHTANIIAMAGIGYGHGMYREDQIASMFMIALTSFSGACTETKLALASHDDTEDKDSIRPCTVIHTGAWGCGAFGGNLFLMTLIQLFAASLSGVNVIVLHSDRSYKTAIEHFDKLLKKEDIWTVEKVIKYLYKLKCRWGVSNGT